MTTGQPAAETGAGTKRSSYLELFFDLVFVFAITQLAGLLHDDHSAAGWGRAALMAWLIWWAWSQFTWAGNAIDLDQAWVRGAMLAVTGVALLAATAIPDAFSADGAWFAVPYVAVRFSGLALYWGGLRGDPAHRQALRTFLPAASVSILLVLAGGLSPDDLRPWIWLLAVVVDLASVAAAGKGEFRVAPAHFAERHALILIIALGESIVAVGFTVADLAPRAVLVLGAASAFAIVATLWWDYFGWAHRLAEDRLTQEPDHQKRSSLARDLFTLLHLPVVAGPVVFAVGVEEALLHPDDPLDAFGRLAVGTGLVLFLAGFVAMAARAGAGLLVERAVAGIFVVVVLLVLGPALDAVAVLVVLAAGLLALAALETGRRGRAPDPV